MMVRAIVIALALAATAAAAEPATVTASFKETDEPFANPYTGWQSFHMAASEDPGAGKIPSSVLYARYYWADFEPVDGKYDWKTIDSVIESAKKDGQSVALRIMTCGTEKNSNYSPAWLRDLGARVHEYQYQGRGRTQWTPDFNDAVFLEKHLAFVKAFGGRYNGSPDVALVDIGSVGLWGEWHMSGTDVPMPTTENTVRIIDAYISAFPDTPLVMQLDHIAGMKYAARSGLGWRVDCWGDLGGFSKTWCHMRSVYPQALKETGSEDLWRKAPVALETCWDMRKWQAEKWDIDLILKWALDKHATYINNKSEEVPGALVPKVQAFVRKLGYRFALRSAAFPAEAAPGGPLPVKLAWANVGVAPCYYDFHPAVALADASGKVVWSKAFTESTTRDWLPGEFATDLAATVPTTVAPGPYTLLVGVTRDDAVPAVRLAIEGRREDGWYPIGAVTLTAK